MKYEWRGALGDIDRGESSRRVGGFGACDDNDDNSTQFVSTLVRSIRGGGAL